MSKHPQLSLEKEKLRLKIKQQEYEIKKTMLDLKDRYHPLNVALNMAGDYIAGNSGEQQQLNSENKNTSPALDGTPFGASGISNFLGQIIALFQNYIELANEVANNKRKNMRQTEEIQEYVIGRDDM